MQRDQLFNVVGLRENGERVVITKDTTHITAERVLSLISGGSAFVRLLIQEADDGELPGVESSSLVDCHS
jgi:hypothetical protein